MMVDSDLRDSLYTNSGMGTLINNLPNDDSINKTQLIADTKNKLLALAQSFNSYYKSNMDITGLSSTVAAGIGVQVTPATGTGATITPGTATQTTTIHPL